jgi:hypothetical protein
MVMAGIQKIRKPTTRHTKDPYFGKKVFWRETPMSHHQCSAGQSFAAIICTELKYNTSPNSDSPLVEYLQQPTTFSTTSFHTHK